MLDLSLPDISGEAILKQVREHSAHLQVIVVTGDSETDTAVRCMKMGAFDYLVKPVDSDRLITSVRRAMHHALLVNQNQILSRKLLEGGLDCPENFHQIITSHPRMQAIFSYLEVVAPTFAPVLITGETGTGKDLLALALHKASGRVGPFVALNAAGLDDNVFADTLFGHVQGAFTDAREARNGLVRQAEGGTLFLDEIGDLSPASQVKLLKLTQDSVYYPLGSDTPRPCKARIVAATNRDLGHLRRDGRFRDDLYYRINTHHVHLPPLRERDDDVVLLADHFLGQACSELNLPRQQCSPRLAELLRAHAFPGNVRELRSLMHAGMAEGGMAALESKLASLFGAVGPSRLFPADEIGNTPQTWNYPDPLPTMEQALAKLIDQALSRSRGNQSQAASMLGISRQALNKRLKKARQA